MTLRRTSESDIASSWITKASQDLETGEEFFVPIENRDIQKSYMKIFKKELQALEQVDPVSANSIHIYPTIREGKFYLVLKKLKPSILVGFKKDLSGKVSKTELDEDQRKRRRISLMIEDGMTYEQIIAIEGDIPEDLRKEIKE